MNNIVNSLLFFIKSIIADEGDKIGGAKQVALRVNRLPLSDHDCIWLLPYYKNKDLLLSLKRGEERHLSYIAKPLCEKLIEISSSAIVVPLPQSNLRIMVRGHNHTLLITAAALRHDKENKLRLEKGNLVKIRETRKQAKLSRTERLREQQGAFRVRRPEKVQGQTIILFDDIVTTGATLSEARKTLLKAGAREVICVALAH